MEPVSSTVSHTTVVAVFGATCSGKTTLCRSIAKIIESEPAGSGSSPLLRNFYDAVEVVSQDEYYKEDGTYEKVEGYDNWETPSAIDFNRLAQTLENKILEPQTQRKLLIIEGHLLQSMEKLSKQIELFVFLKVSKEECRKRRLKRDEWLRDNPRYFDLCIWPMHQKYCIDVVEGVDGTTVKTLDAEAPLQDVIEEFSRLLCSIST
eukprot:TRINITY_DN1204_c0_g1_i1.p1 TRINITY_DN1204_c0_g1~~TRINITY_DN1204_c0_g1_i1.p1  ORF type:complete len:206 (-),score=23.08 TRINITY_DN1204_c0_g1_i1:67-684(-)